MAAYAICGDSEKIHRLEFPGVHLWRKDSVESRFPTSFIIRFRGESREDAALQISFVNGIPVAKDTMFQRDCRQRCVVQQKDVAKDA